MERSFSRQLAYSTRRSRRRSFLAAALSFLYLRPRLVLRSTLRSPDTPQRPAGAHLDRTRLTQSSLVGRQRLFSNTSPSYPCVLSQCLSSSTCTAHVRQWRYKPLGSRGACRIGRCAGGIAMARGVGPQGDGSRGLTERVPTHALYGIQLCEGRIPLPLPAGWP
jgi:hypothetical protein